jgi:hypothetical protein
MRMVTANEQKRFSFSEMRLMWERLKDEIGKEQKGSLLLQLGENSKNWED